MVLLQSKEKDRIEEEEDEYQDGADLKRQLHSSWTNNLIAELKIIGAVLCGYPMSGSCARRKRGWRGEEKTIFLGSTGVSGDWRPYKYSWRK